MMHSESLNELAAALSAAQRAMRPVAYDATNPHFKSRYASLAAIVEALREPLATNGLAVSQVVSSDAAGQPVLETVLMHTSGQYLAGAYPLRPARGETPQDYGSALTYARRYALAAITGAVADDDDDGNAGSRPTTKAPERRFERRATANTVVAQKAPVAPTGAPTPPPAPTTPAEEFDKLPSASTDPQRAAVLAKANGHQAADLPARPTWHSPDEAKAWAAKQVDVAGQLVFAHGKHVANSYDLQRRRYLDDNGDKATAGGFFDAWYAHVQTKIAEANAKLASAEEHPQF